jgi:hypothetical protein
LIRNCYVLCANYLYQSDVEVVSLMRMDAKAGGDLAHVNETAKLSPRESGHVCSDAAPANKNNMLREKNTKLEEKETKVYNEMIQLQEKTIKLLEENAELQKKIMQLQEQNTEL